MIISEVLHELLIGCFYECVISVLLFISDVVFFFFIKPILKFNHQKKITNYYDCVYISTTYRSIYFFFGISF